jgi:hypothetical protein
LPAFADPTVGFSARQSGALALDNVSRHGSTAAADPPTPMRKTADGRSAKGGKSHHHVARAGQVLPEHRVPYSGTLVKVEAEGRLFVPAYRHRTFVSRA